MTSATVLIASPEHLPLLKAQTAGGGEVIAFTDSEALRALDLITRKRPNVVALERLFASTSRGAALINRIKADPALTACEIRIVAHDTSAVRAGGRAADSTAPAAVAELPPPPAKSPLDQRGTRRAPRFRVVDDIEVSIDGNPALLVDLSIVGAMVVSPSILRPNQRVRLSLPRASRPIRVNAGVAWAFFEMPKGKTQYRAGIDFFDADTAAVQTFLDDKKKRT